MSSKINKEMTKLKNSFKIFLVHKGRQPYLKIVIEQLLIHNNPKDIVLFTDNKEETKKFLGYGIVYENIVDYFSYASDFEKIYSHLSQNSKGFELFCFQRRFIILEYLEKNNISFYCHIDSDCLIYCDLKQYYYNLDHLYDFTYVGSCGHISIGSKLGLKLYMNFVFNSYKNNLKNLISYYNGDWSCDYYLSDKFFVKENLGCVSDMTLIYLFVKETDLNNNIKTKNIGLLENDMIFDHVINYDEGFMFFKFIKPFIKKIFYDKQEKKYYSYLSSDMKKKRKIYFNCIHCQGYAKCIIDCFPEIKKYYFLKPYFKLIYASLKINIKRVFKVIKKIIGID